MAKTYNSYGFSFDVEDLDPKGVQYLIERGIAHLFGNQVASKVAAAKEKQAKDKKPDFSDVELATMAHDFRKVFMDALLDGTIGGGSTGPRIVGVERVMRDVAEEQVRAAWTKHKKGQPLPKGKDMAALIDKNIAKNGESIRQLAQDRMDAVADLGEIEL